MVDPIFGDPRLVAVYDVFEGVRTDLDTYVAAVQESRATSVLDVGCGTGVLARRLAADGIEVVAVDPALASLEVAREGALSELVRWVHGDATGLPPLKVGAATMTGNVAQVFLTEGEFAASLAGIHRALRPGGWLVFETRDPARRAWDRWNREHTYATADVPGMGRVTTWCDVLSVDEPLVTFRWTHVFAASGETLTSDSTLRFWEREEVARLLTCTGFDGVDVRDAPDRPGAEFVFIAERRP